MLNYESREAVLKKEFLLKNACELANTFPEIKVTAVCADLNQKMNIEEIVKSIRERHRYLSYWNGSPFWYCLGQDDILKLFQDSMREELEMVPDWFYAQGGEKALRNDFNHFVTQGGLCSMNITAVLNNQSLVGSLLVQQ